MTSIWHYDNKLWGYTSKKGYYYVTVKPIMTQNGIT